MHTLGGVWLFMCLVMILWAVPAHAALTGMLQVTVRDAKTSAPLSGVELKLTQGGFTTFDKTDDDGMFLFRALQPGTYVLTANLVGYEVARVTDVGVSQDRATRITVSLNPIVVTVPGAEAMIVASRAHLHPEVTGSSYIVTAQDEQMTLSQPNDRYQFPGLVFGQPGVVPDSTFFPHIRGSRSTQVGYMIDGIPIVEPNNNVFATNLMTIGLSRLELLTGGWDAQYGSQVGGVINEVIKTGDQVMGRYAEVAAGSPTELHQVIAEAGDVGSRPGSSYYVATSVWDTRYPGDNFLNRAPLVADILFKGVEPVGKNGSLTLLAGHGYGSFQLHNPQTRGFDSRTGLFVDIPRDIDNVDQGYYLDALTYQHGTTDSSDYWTARIFGLGDHITMRVGSDVFMSYQQRQQNLLGLQLDYVRQFDADHVLSTGVWRIDSDNHWRFARDVDPMFGPFDQQANNDTTNWQLYVQDTRRIAPRLVLGLGLRYETMSYDRPTFGELNLAELSPRAGLTYEVIPSRLLVRLSAGKYIQFPPASRTGQLFREGDPNNPEDPPSWYVLQEGRSQLKAQEDINREIGLEYKVDRDTLLTLTAFRRTAKHMLQRWAGPTDDTDDFDPETFSPYPFRFASNGRGSFRGLELKLDRKMTDNLRFWLSYTHLNAKATASLENAFPLGLSTTGDPDSLFPVDWDQRDTVAFAAHWRRGRFGVSPWFIWGSGFPYALQSGLDIDPDGGFNYIHDEFGNEIPILVDGKPQQSGAPNSLRTGSNFVFSLNVTYKQNDETEWFVDIYNIFNRRDVTNLVWYHPDTGAILGLHAPTAEYPNGYIDYIPFTTTLPRSFTFGFKQRF